MSVGAEDAGVGARSTRSKPNGRGSSRRLRLVAFDEILLDRSRRYLVKGIMPRVGLVVVYGPPKSLKSFWLFDLLMHVALGWSYRGRRVQQGSIVYCVFEGAENFQARVEAWRQRFLPEDHESVPFFAETISMDLVKERSDLVVEIRLTLGDTAPAAVVLDTLNRSLVGSENRDEDMSQYIRAADAIREALNCCVVIVHHCGVEGSRPRGHSSLTGAADAQLAVKRDGEIITVTVEHQRDGPEGAVIASRYEPVDLGPDDDGDPIVSLILVPTDAPAGKAAGSRTAKLPKGAQIALEALREAIQDVGTDAPASNHVPANVRVATVADWRNFAFRRGISASDDGDARRRAFKRATDTLIAAKLVGFWDPYAWLAI